MKRLLVSIAVLVLAGSLAVPSAFSGGHPVGDGVQIEVSPKTIVLKAPVVWVTVHTNVGPGAVMLSTLELNGVPVGITKTDSLGYLVAKFRMDAVGATLEVGTQTLTMTGLLSDGTEFAATDTVQVK